MDEFMACEAAYQNGKTAGYKEGIQDAGGYEIPGCSCVSNAMVYGLESSIKRAKYPMSVYLDSLSGVLTDGIKRLAMSERGAGHDQFLTGIIVQFDLTFTNKAFVEAERYHFLDFVSSQSTMHRIAKFDLDKAYDSHVDPRIVAIMKEKVSEYNDLPSDCDGDLKAEKYLEILYSNPAGFKLTAGMTTNYRQLKTIYAQRRTHRLPEWREFCKWIETLPMSFLITGKEPEAENGTQKEN